MSETTLPSDPLLPAGATPAGQGEESSSKEAEAIPATPGEGTSAEEHPGATPGQEKVLPPLALVIEDSKIIRRFLTMQISKLGFEMREAEDGLQGLKILAGPERKRITVIFLDVMMPGMDGMTFLLTARKEYGRSLPPVIVCTTKTDRKTVTEFIVAGACAYIIKPFKTEILQLKLKELNLLP